MKPRALPPDTRRLRLSAVLAELDDPVEPGAPPPDRTLGEILDRTAHAGYGFLLAFLALIAIPFVGISLAFGLAVAVLGAQMLMGRPRPWLPGFLRRRKLPPGALRWLSETLARVTARLERLVKPRLQWLVHGRVIGLGLVFQGIGLALPLPFPGSNWIFIVPILIYAFGLLEDDGAWVLVAHLANAVQVVLAILFAKVVRVGIDRVIGWFS
jgi:hypothetical protein